MFYPLLKPAMLVFFVFSLIFFDFIIRLCIVEIPTNIITKMKKLLIPILLVTSFSAHSAEYQARYHINGISAPQPAETWKDLPPVYGTWTNKGAATNCTTKTPLENTVALGTSFNQTLSGCMQQQIRSVRIDQISSKGTTKTGVATNENQTLSNYSYMAIAIGTKEIPVCNFSNTVPYTRWYDVSKQAGDSSNIGYYMDWNSSVLINTVDGSYKPRVNSFTSGGYVYTRGALKLTQIYSSTQGLYFYYYEVCRSPVN